MIVETRKRKQSNEDARRLGRYGGLSVFRRLRVSLLSATALAGVLTTDVHAQSVWNGATADYNTNANWTNNIAPVAAGQSAEYTNTGSASVNVSAAVAPDAWTFDANAQAYTITGDQVTFGGAGIINNAASMLSIQNVIAGTGGLTQAGTGILFISGANTYTGNTILQAGTLQIASNSAIGTGTLEFAGGTLSGGNLTLANAVTIDAAGGTIDANGGTQTLSGNIANGNAATGGLTITEPAGVAGTVILSGASTYTGPTTVASTVTLQAGSTTALSASSTFDVEGTLNLNNFSNTVGSLAGAGNVTLGTATLTDVGFQPLLGGVMNFTGTISGTGGFILNQGAFVANAANTDGAALAELSGANTYSGGTTIVGGNDLVVGNSSALGTGLVTMTSGGAVLTFDINAAFNIANNFAIGTGAVVAVNQVFADTISGVIADMNPIAPGTLTKESFGTLILTGANTYSGGTTIGAGAIQVGVDTVGTPGAITSSAIGTGTLTLDTGTLQAGGAFTIANAVALNTGGGTIDSNGNNFTLSGPIANGNGAGTLTIADSAAAGGVVVVTGAGTYTGATLVQSGTLRAGNGNVFSAASDYTVTGTLDLNNFDNTIGSLAGTGNVTLGVATLTTGDTVNTTFSGTISGAGGLGKQGTDTFTLSGENTYTGITSVDAGVLLGGAANTFSAASMTMVGVAGTLDLGGFAQTINNVTLNGGVLQNGSLTGAVASNGGAIATIAGPATVTIAAGTTTFEGTNTYTGATAVDGGTATANANNAFSANSATSVAAGGTIDLGGFAQTINNVTLNGGVLQNGSLTGAVASNGGVIATIAGPASFTIAAGKTIFAGPSTYTGATAVDGGTATAAENNAYSANSATSVAAGGTLDLGGFAQTINNVTLNGGVLQNGSLTGAVASNGGAIATIAGPATVTIAAATTIFEGTNTYTGATAIDGGTATANANNAFSANSATSVAAGGTLDLGGFNQTLLSLSGAGVVQNNGGALATLTIANDGSPSDFTGVIKDGASQTGLAVSSGTQVLEGANTYTGGTTVAAGAALIVGGGGASGSIVGNVVDDGVLAFNRSDTFTYAGVVSGTGALDQLGSGTLVLSGANTYSGPTTVAAGTLTVTGSIVSPTEIMSGAMLNGTGTVGAVTVDNGGTLGAGTNAAIGVVQINGNATFLPGSNYSVRITSANQNDITIISGAANLAGGTVRVMAQDTNFNNAGDTRFLILNAGRIASPFAGVATNFAFLTPTLSYDANNVFLDIGNPNFAAATAPTANESIGQALQNAFNAGATGAGATLLNDVAGLSAAQAPAALTQLSGQATSATQEVSLDAGRLFMDALNDQSQQWIRGGRGGSATNEIVLQAKPLSYAPSLTAQANAAFFALDGVDAVPATRTWRAWGTGFTSGETLKDLDGGMLDLSHRTSGGGFGADYQVNPSLLVGFGLGGSTSSFDVAQSFTSGRLDGAHAGVYAAGKFSDFYTTAALTYAHFENTTNRMVTDVGPIASEQGRFGSDQAGGSFEAGYRKDMGQYAITPFASIAYFDTFQNGYSETGANADLYGLTFGAHNASSVPVTIGAQIDGRFDIGNGWLLEPFLRAAYDHQTIRQRQIDASFTNIPLSFFTANGIVADEDVADLKLGARLIVSPRTSLYANLEGVASSRTRGYAAMFGISMLNDDIKSATVNPNINSVAASPWTSSVTPDIRVDSFRGSRGFPTSSSLAGGSGSQVYASTVIQASGTILPDTRLDLLAKPGFVSSRQSTIGLSGSAATPADTTASATFTYLAINGVQPFFSLNFNLPSGRTVLLGTAANARLDPDFVSVGTFGQGLNIGPTIGVNLPFSEQLTGSLSAGYTHQGSYNKEAAIDPTTFSQGTQVFQPGSDITFSANIGYVVAPFNTQASLSYAKESITFTNGSPTFQAGDRFIGSLTEAYSWSPTSITSFTGTLSYSERNNTLNTSLPAFLAEAFNSNNFVTRLRLDHTFAMDKWTYGPLLGFVYRNRNGYDETTAQFVPGKTIISGGASAGYAFNEKISAKASLEYFEATEANNPASSVGTVHTNGFRAGLTGTFAF